MNSCTATAPIDIPTKSNNTNPIKGTFNCVYDPDMCSGASVTISSDRAHLSINCSSGSKSTISFYGKPYVPTEIRIYAPSLHTYSGSQADAEIMIVHAPGSNANSDSDGLIVSVPVTLSSSGSSSGSSDLAAIIQAANSINANTLAINASAPINYDVNANSFIPDKPYFVYYGTLPYDSCGGNYYYAVFTDTVSAAGPLSALVASNIATVQLSMKTNLQKSMTGPNTGAGSGSSDEYVLFEMIGDDCDGDGEDDGSGSNAKAVNGSKIRSAKSSFGMNLIWGLLIAFILLGISYIFLTNGDASSTGSSAGPAPAPSAPPLNELVSSGSSG